MVKTIDSQWRKNELLDLQRWEDEGGQMIENSAPLPDPLAVPPASIKAGRHHASLQWNEQFVIERFQPTDSLFWMRKKHTRKTG